MSKLFAAVVFLQVGDEFLIIDRATLPFGWALPGGRVEPDEAPVDAAVREIQEECGIAINKDTLEFNGIFTSANAAYLVHLYSSRMEQKPEVFIQEREVKDYKWITSENINNYIWSGKSKTWVEQLSQQ